MMRTWPEWCLNNSKCCWHLTFTCHNQACWVIYCTLLQEFTTTATRTHACVVFECTLHSVCCSLCVALCTCTYSVKWCTCWIHPSAVCELPSWCTVLRSQRYVQCIPLMYACNSTAHCLSINADTYYIILLQEVIQACVEPDCRSYRLPLSYS
jgi:hypothetical protein